MICPKCDGSGMIDDPREIGSRLRQMRLKSGMSLRSMAKRLRLSAPYLSDIELGRRTASPALQCHYISELKQPNQNL